MIKNNINKYKKLIKLNLFTTYIPKTLTTLNKKMYKMVIDTETTGLLVKNKETKKYYHPSNIEMYNSSRIVSIAWSLYDADGNLHNSKYFIVKPDGFVSHPEALKVHKITKEYADANGIPIKNIFEELYLDIDNTEEFIAYNAEFDYNIILGEMYREKQNIQINNLIEYNTSYFEKINNMIEKIEHMNATNRINCVMKLSKNKIKDIKARYKLYPRMEEVYRHLFTENDFNTSHNAMDDVHTCAKIYWKLINTS